MARSILVCPDCKTPITPKQANAPGWRGELYDCIGCKKTLKKSQFESARSMTIARGGAPLGGFSGIVPIGRTPLGTNSGTGATGLTTLFSNVSLGVGNGLVVYIASIPATSNPTTMTWNGNAMTVDFTVAGIQIGSSLAFMDCFYIGGVGAGTGNVVIDLSVTGDLNEWVAFATQITGSAAATFKDRSKAASGSSPSPSTGASQTTLNDNDLLLAAVAWEDTNTSGSWSNNFTAGQSLAAGTLAIEEGFRIVSAKAAYTAAKTGADNDEWAAGLLAIRRA